MAQRTPLLRIVPRLASFLLVLFAVLLSTRNAEAYAWMIRHEYGGCATCHVDPSGGGLLTPFGRTQADAYLHSHYGAPSDGTSNADDLLWGAVTPPDWLLAGGSLRTMTMRSKIDGGRWANDFILMQADLRASVQVGGFRAYGSIGAINNDSSPASIAGGLVSREHWLGYSLADDTVLVRAGRIDLPFGIRQIEHTMFVRSATRTDINDTQQHGVSIAYSGETIRAELMGIAGNYQVRPDAFRERGYSGYVEWAFAPRYAVGASSLFTHANEDIYYHVANTRQAHGGFFRIAPAEPIVFLGEVDYVGQSLEGQSRWNGLATMLQADVEPWQGLHFVATGETYAMGGPSPGSSWSAWGGVTWFFTAHLDARFDYMHRSQVAGLIRLPEDSLMLQLHLYL